MKKIISIVILIILLTACSTVRYTSGRISDIKYITDSIETVDPIRFPPIGAWLNSTLISNDGVVITYTYYEKIKRDKYTLSVIQKDSVFYYKYRVE